MQERAELTGASLRFGPTLDGGWQVVLQVPVGAAPADADRPAGSGQTGASGQAGPATSEEQGR